MARILDGVRVVEHGTFITGPFAAMMLADLGAEVIKVERAGEGDPYRSFKGGLYAPHFQANNRNKQSLAVDLSTEADRTLLRQLIATADVFVQNFRPGVAEKLGLGAEALMAANPRLICCSISGFGPDGPYVDRPSYDTVAQGFSGYLSMFVDPREPRIAGPAMADTTTGLFAANGILAALVERARTGRGRHVEVSMVGAMAQFASEPYANYFNSGVPWGPYDRATVSQSYALECADGGLIALHLSSPPKFWEGLVQATGHPELAADPRFETRAARMANYRDLNEALRPIFLERTRDDWRRRLEAADVPHAPILTLAETLRDEQVRHMGLERSDDHPAFGAVRSIARAVAFDGERAGFDFTPAPALDEHGEALRRGLQAPAADPASPAPARPSAPAGVVPAHMRGVSQGPAPGGRAGPNRIVEQAVEAMSPEREGADPVLQGKLAVILRRLHEAIDEADLKEHELLAAYAFLDRVGANGDMMLLGDHFGVSMRVNDLTYGSGLGTAPNVLGPLYRDDAPFMDNPGEMIPPNAEGRHVRLHGRVTDAVTGAPVPHAVLDFWQTDAKGFYDYQSGELQDYDFRRRIRADADGGFSFRTVVPNAYEIANRDTPVTELMRKLGRRSFRAPHIHVIVTGAGYRSLTTLVYFEGEPLNDEDCIFSCRPENTVTVTPPAEPGGTGDAVFDVRLVPSPAT